MADIFGKKASTSKNLEQRKHLIPSAASALDRILTMFSALTSSISLIQYVTYGWRDPTAAPHVFSFFRVEAGDGDLGQARTISTGACGGSGGRIQCLRPHLSHVAD